MQLSVDQEAFYDLGRCVHRGLTLRAPAMLGRVVFYLLLAAGGVAAVNGLAIAWGLVLLAGDRARGPLTLWADYTEVTALLLLAISAVTAVAYLTWLYRVVHRTRDLDGPGKSSVMAVLWWFVPIAFLFMPYRVVADLRRRVAGDANHGARSVQIWWAAWLGGIGLGRVAGVMPVDSVDDAVAWIFVSLVSAMALVVAAIFAADVVRNISRGVEAQRTPVSQPIETAVHAPEPDQMPAVVRAPTEWKVCPDCAEQIRHAAQVCRFCRHAFEVP